MAVSETRIADDIQVGTPLDERADAARAVARVPALVTLAFGIVVLFCVGFLQVSAVHNGAHDTRHANGFPCH